MINIVKPNVLIVDDDSRILGLLKQFFSKNDFKTYGALDATEAEQIMREEEIDLLILDVMLPGVTGFEFAAKIKKRAKKTPIILLTALTEPDDRVKGLEVGADDYITKPFDPRELILRARKLLDLYHTSYPAAEKAEIFKFGSCQYNNSTKTLFRNAEQISLSSTESKLLDYLIQHRGNAIPRDALSNFMGGLSDRSIDVQIVRLRQKIEQDSKKPKFLLTIRHEGYGVFF